MENIKTEIFLGIEIIINTILIISQLNVMKEVFI